MIATVRARPTCAAGATAAVIAFTACGGGQPSTLSSPQASSGQRGVRVTVPPPLPAVASATLEASSITLRDIATDDTDGALEPDGEPSIAVNPLDPNEISVVAFSGNWGTSVSGAAPIWKSFDGGAMWEKLPLITAPKRIVFPAPLNRVVDLDGPSDLSLAYDERGRLIVAAMGSDKIRWSDDFTLNLLYRQTGGPRDPLTLESTFGDGFLDQPMLSSGTGSCATRTYAAWLRKDRQVSMHSVAEGGTLVSLGAVDDTELPTRTTRIAVDRSGTAYLLYKTRILPDAEVQPVSYRVRRSDDCGRSWNALGGSLGVRVHAAPLVKTLYTDDFGHRRRRNPDTIIHPRAMSSDAWIAVHAVTGDVYVAYVAVAANGNGQIVMAKSSDKGRMWTSAPVTDSRTMAAYPEIAVNDDGVVAVLFIDYDSAAPTDFRHRLALSADDGATWMTSTLQTLRPEELANKPDEIIDLWGDYEGLTSHGSTFYGVFAGESIDRKIRNLDPIFFKLDAHRHHETSEPAAPPSPRPAPRPTATYTVVRGDSLWRIARARTREGHKWTEIYSRNRATIKNPHRIYPEQSLAMPW